jgi:hypothetical protein
MIIKPIRIEDLKALMGKKNNISTVRKRAVRRSPGLFLPVSKNFGDVLLNGGFLLLSKQTAVAVGERKEIIGSFPGGGDSRGMQGKPVLLEDAAYSGQDAGDIKSGDLQFRCAVLPVFQEGYQGGDPEKSQTFGMSSDFRNFAVG